MASRLFNRITLGLALGAALIAPISPAMAQRPPEKEAVKPIKVDPIQHAQTITYAVDADISHDPENVLLLDLSNGGRVAIRLMPEWAPGHVERIKTLTKEGFYNGVIFHRVIEGFMAQTGDVQYGKKGADTTMAGMGGSDLPNIPAEFSTTAFDRGIVSWVGTKYAPRLSTVGRMMFGQTVWFVDIFGIANTLGNL
jgi:peptidylprolyl isomerase